jgi:transcriptional regulator with XRE-family HTH domain
MTKRDLGRHYFKEWRQYRGLSLKRAVERTEKQEGGEPIISAMSLSRIERGLQPYSEEVVLALAAAYNCDEPADLLLVNPLVEGKVVDLNRYVRSIPPKQAAKALAVLKTALSE